MSPDNIIHGKKGLVWKTSLKGGDWKFDLQAGLYGNTNGKKWDTTNSLNNVGGVILSTSSPFIEMPFSDYIQLIALLLKHEKHLT